MNDISKTNIAETQHVETAATAKLGQEVHRLNHESDGPVPITWRTWLVVFTCGFFAVFVQIFSTVAAPSVIAFIIQDLQDANLAVWVIQAPLLIQAAISPMIGRLSDVLDRKLMIVVAPLIAFAGSVIAAKSSSMGMLIAGTLLIGPTLATLGIVQSIAAEVLPLRQRAIANGIAFLGGSIGGTVGGFAAGAFCRNPAGWRNLFWLQAAFQITASISIFISYWPPKSHYRRYTNMKDIIWACDPAGSVLFIGGSTLVLLALNWASGTYAWSNVHVVAPLVVGFLVLVVFVTYEVFGRTDGLLAHVFFREGRNFGLALFVVAVEGWIFYGAINTVLTQMPFYLGWQTNSLGISVRQISYFVPTWLASLVVMWYTTRYREIRWPLVLCFTLCLASVSAYAAIRTSWSAVQLGIAVLLGLGQSAPLILLIVIVQFAAPHAYIANASATAFSFRAIGGAFGSAVLFTIINGHVGAHYPEAAAEAVIKAGLPSGQVPILLQVMANGNGPPTVDALFAVASGGLPNVSVSMIASARAAGEEVYAKAYQLAWASIVPFVAIAVVCCLAFKSVETQMTDEIEVELEARGVEKKAVEVENV